MGTVNAQHSEVIRFLPRNWYPTKPNTVQNQPWGASPTTAQSRCRHVSLSAWSGVWWQPDNRPVPSPPRQLVCVERCWVPARGTSPTTAQSRRLHVSSSAWSGVGYQPVVPARQPPSPRRGLVSVGANGRVGDRSGTKHCPTTNQTDDRRQIRTNQKNKSDTLPKVAIWVKCADFPRCKPKCRLSWRAVLRTADGQATDKSD
jgi:hypothetical protein